MSTTLLAGFTRRLLIVAGLAGLTLAVGCAETGGAMETWTIRVITVRGESQFDDAQQLVDSLKTVEQLQPDLINLQFDEDGATIFYGRYDRIWDARRNRESFRPDPDPDLALIRSLMFTGGAQPFASAMVAPLPTASVGREEWSAESASGYYSLQIAVFYNTPTFSNRKQAAVDYCKQLRDEGVEAWYYHGPVRSVVTIGSFPEDAVRTVSREIKTRPSLTGESSTRDVVHAETMIANSRMRRLRKEYPHNLHNGHIVYDRVYNPETRRRERVAEPSFAVKFPNADNPVSVTPNEGGGGSW